MSKKMTENEILDFQRLKVQQSKRYFLTSILAFILVFGYSVQSKAECWDGNCENGWGVEDNICWHYEGFFKDEKFNGKGKLTLKPMSGMAGTYEGTFKDGHPKFITYIGPDRYFKGEVKVTENGDDEWYNGIFFKSSFGKTFVATYKNCVETLVYSGDFENGKYNGIGTLYYDSGRVKYDGRFKNEFQTGNYDQNRIIEIYGTTGKI